MGQLANMFAANQAAGGFAPPAQPQGYAPPVAPQAAPQYPNLPAAAPQGYPPPAAPIAPQGFAPGYGQQPQAPAQFAPPPQFAPQAVPGYPPNPAPGFPQGFAPQAAPGFAPQGYPPPAAGMGGLEHLNFSDAKISESTTKLGLGDFILTIDRNVIKHTQQYGMAYIVEFMIDQTNSPTTPAGTKGSWYQSLTDTTTAVPNLFGFLAAALGIPASDEARLAPIRLGAVRALTEAAQTQEMKGRKVRCHVEERISKKNGQPYKRYSFFPFVG